MNNPQVGDIVRQLDWTGEVAHTWTITNIYESYVDMVGLWTSSHSYLSTHKLVNTGQNTWTSQLPRICRTVGELIEELQKHDPSTIVGVYSDNDEGGDTYITLQTQRLSDETTLLYYKSDNPVTYYEIPEMLTLRG